jgi:hypothetical protein
MDLVLGGEEKLGRRLARRLGELEDRRSKVGELGSMMTVVAEGFLQRE